MMTDTQMYGQVFGDHHFGSLFSALGLCKADEQAQFETLYDQLDRHSVFFGCAAHPDVEDGILEQVWQITLKNLADSARRGASDDVRWYVVSQFLRTLRSSRGLPPGDVDKELQAALAPAAERLADALSWTHVLMYFSGPHRPTGRISPSMSSRPITRATGPWNTTSVSVNSTAVASHAARPATA